MAQKHNPFILSYKPLLTVCDYCSCSPQPLSPAISSASNSRLPFSASGCCFCSSVSLPSLPPAICDGSSASFYPTVSESDSYLGQPARLLLCVAGSGESGDCHPSPLYPSPSPSLSLLHPLSPRQKSNFIAHNYVFQDISFLPPPIPRHATDFSLRLPKGWRENISHGDQGWIGHALFVSKGKLATNLKLWWHPPDYKLPTGQPSPDTYHHQRLFLWMPRRMWRVEFTCPTCPTPQYLRSKGVYNHVRLVMGSKDRFYLAGEYMDCNACHRTYISWDSR